MNAPRGRGTSWIWATLAVVDAVALVYVAASFDWSFETAKVGPTPAGWIVQIVVTALTIGLKLLVAAAIAAVGFAIVMDVRGTWRPSRWLAALMTPLFLAVLALVAFELAGEIRPALDAPAMQLSDRLVVFDRLAVARTPGQSLGAFLAVLVLATYLAEKYLLRWWNLRWPVSLLGLAIALLPAWLAHHGEHEQREWVAAQQWHPVAERKTWLDALSACSALGPEWRLPRKLELALYVAESPEAIRSWHGAAWTLVESEMGRNAVVVELEPRRAGYWRSNIVPWRDRSLCELDANASARAASDWFTALRPRLCEAPADHEGMHASTVQLIASIRGSIVGGPEPKLITQPTEAAAICVKTAPPEIPELRHRRYPKEREFRDAESFLAQMRDACNPRAPGADAAACAAFAAEAPAAIAR